MSFLQPKKNRKTLVLSILMALLLVLSLALLLVTVTSLRELPDDLSKLTQVGIKPQLLDRSGQPLNITFQNHWNLHDQRALHDIPVFLQKAFVLAEDKRFYHHSGIDWSARVNAVVQNVLSFRGVRGASTISEQVVRMIHQRPRTIWSRWLEGWEAENLEAKFDKASILEFYLNQVPYAAQRRGVVQASRYYFDRDLFTLSQKEMLSLAILVRAPSRFDLHKSVTRIDGRLKVLAQRAQESGLIDNALEVIKAKLLTKRSESMVDASHFARYMYQQLEVSSNIIADGPEASVSKVRIQTTLDSKLQAFANRTLRDRLDKLSKFGVNNAGMVVVDHQNSEVLVWSVGNSEQSAVAAFDSVLTKRQPGSTLKPFVYAAAIEKGWSASTLIDDSPLREGVGLGVHNYRNYSNTYYGKISVRNALGNSLNIPAIKAAKYVGLNPLLDKLSQLGLKELDLRSVDYGNGIALGNGEVSLLSMVQAYAVIANAGEFLPIKTINGKGTTSAVRVYSPEVASLIGNVLSDADARTLEFGHSSVLNMPVQTAVKTGTSNDYRDAWVFGYDHRYVVGVWMGNLDNSSTDKVTGSIGPALAMREMFSELRRGADTKPLYLSPRLQLHQVCVDTGTFSDGVCASKNEYFLPGSKLSIAQGVKKDKAGIQLLEPIDQMQVAFDPRIPVNLQYIEFKLNSLDGVDKVEWYVNGEWLATNKSIEHSWPVRRGNHRVQAKVFLSGERRARLLSASYSVK